jgi:hypothetical protein
VKTQRPPERFGGLFHLALSLAQQSFRPIWAHGEYFFFISEGSGRPFFKHVTQGNAKIALGRKYVAPTQVSG